MIWLDWRACFWALALFPIVFLVNLSRGVSNRRDAVRWSQAAVAVGERQPEVDEEQPLEILRIDPETKKIGLSARAVGKDEPIIDTKIYSSEAGGGMASLGELADFGLSKADTDE